MKNTSNKIINWSLALCSTFLCLLLIESFFRIAYPQIQQHNEMFQANSTLGWEFVPNKSSSIVYQGEIHQYVQTNEMGFRDKTYKTPNKSKILVVGDSFVSNISVPADSVFTEQLEAKFDSTVVVNCGVNGYGQVQEYLLLEDLIPKIQPDLIILQIYLQNDFSDNTGNMWLYPRPKIIKNMEDQQLKVEMPTSDEQQQLQVKRKAFYKKIHLLAFIKRNLLFIGKRYFGVETNKYDFEPFELTYCNPNADVFVSQLEIMKKMLISIHQMTQQHNVDILYTLAPSIYQVDPSFWKLLRLEYPHLEHTLQTNYANDQMLLFANEHHLPMLDLTPIIKKNMSSKEAIYYPKEQHWTANGNRIVADFLYEYLSKNHSFK